MLRVEINPALRKELDRAYQEQLLTDREYETFVTFIAEIVGQSKVRLFFVNAGQPDYDEVGKPKLQAFIVTDELMYDFVVGSAGIRYDVVRVAAVCRIEEKKEEEPSVEGPPRTKVTVTIDYDVGAWGANNTLIAFGDQASKLSAFARQMKDFALLGAR